MKIVVLLGVLVSVSCGVKGPPRSFAKDPLKQEKACSQSSKSTQKELGKEDPNQ